MNIESQLKLRALNCMDLRRKVNENLGLSCCICNDLASDYLSDFYMAAISVFGFAEVIE